MSKRVYALRILVETSEAIEIVESRMRGWGEATFEGFILLELVATRTSLVDMDTLSHSIASMAKDQEALQIALKNIIDVLTKTSGHMQALLLAMAQRVKPDEATIEDA